MRSGVLGLILVLILGSARAQSVDDEIQRLIIDYEKLSQFNQSLKNLYTAYTVVEKGYLNIRDIAQGNFNLHRAFLDALLAVSPVVRDYVKIGSIVSKEAEIIKSYQEAIGGARAAGAFSDGELTYFESVYSNLIDGSARNVEELTMVITAGVLRMSDAQRLAAIDRIDEDIGQKLVFMRGFNARLAMQVGMRKKARGDIDAMRVISGIK